MLRPRGDLCVILPAPNPKNVARETHQGVLKAVGNWGDEDLIVGSVVVYRTCGQFKTRCDGTTYVLVPSESIVAIVQ